MPTVRSNRRSRLLSDSPSRAAASHLRASGGRCWPSPYGLDGQIRLQPFQPPHEPLACRNCRSCLHASITAICAVRPREFNSPLRGRLKIFSAADQQLTELHAANQVHCLAPVLRADLIALPLNRGNPNTKRRQSLADVMHMHVDGVSSRYPNGSSRATGFAARPASSVASVAVSPNSRPMAKAISSLRSTTNRELRCTLISGNPGGQSSWGSCKQSPSGARGRELFARDPELGCWWHEQSRAAAHLRLPSTRLYPWGEQPCARITSFRISGKSGSQGSGTSKTAPFGRYLTAIGRLVRQRPSAE